MSQVNLLPNKACRRKALADQYEAKIKTYHEAIRRVKEEYNSDCSATGGLPSEILGMIFYLLSTEAYQTPTSPQPSSLSWRVVTHVCRSWRAAALSEPQLWANLIDIPKSWFEAYFWRSKAVPVRVQYTKDGRDEPEPMRGLLEKLLHSPERFGVLEWHDCDPEFIYTNFRKSLPRLRTLIVNTPFNFPVDLFGGLAPNLQSLTLQSAAAPFGVSWLANIRELTLSQAWGILDGQRLVPLTVKSFLEVLSTLPLLEVLTVTFGQSPGFSQTPSSPATPLAKLHTIRFTSESATVKLCGILSYIVTPSLRHLSVSWADRGIEPDGLKKVCSFFVAQAGALLDTIEDGSSSSRGGFISLSDASKRMSLTLAGRSVPRAPIFLACGYLNCCVRTLRHASAERPTMQDSETIEELHFVGSPSALILFTEQKPKDVVPGCPYLSLRRLGIENIHFKPKAMFLPGLKAWLKGRKKALAMMDELRLENCQNLTDKDIQMLSKHVGKVCWNGTWFYGTGATDEA